MKRGRNGLVVSGVVLVAAVALIATSAGSKPYGAVVEIQSVASSGAHHVEGSITGVRLQRGDAGEQLFHGEWLTRPGAATVRHLSAGAYRVSGWTLVCEGTCAHLDPPSERCSKRIVIGKDDRSVHVKIVQRPGQACKVRVG